MRDGIYKVHISGGGIKGFMIGTLNQGRLTGCDQSHHVTGYVKSVGNHHKGEMVMHRHAKPDGFVEIANMDVIEIAFAGICGASVGEFDARITGRPDLPIKATFQWICGF
jgi:hypothetical protein